MEQILKHHADDGILTLTFNRPEKLNALNRAVLEDLLAVLTAAKVDPSIKGVLLTGNGKAFCAGADIQELAQSDALKGYEFARFGQQVFDALAFLGKPSIALVNGFALGGGCELMQAATLRIAAKEAKFGQPEIKLGVIPGYGGTQRLTRLIGQGRALDLCLTGRMIDAEVALDWGLVSEVVEAAHLLAIGQTRMQAMLKLAPLALSATMEVIQRGADMPLNDALALEALHFAKLCASEDKCEGTQAFLQKRAAAFKGQ